jgi:hypothetical protein
MLRQIVLLLDRSVGGLGGLNQRLRHWAKPWSVHEMPGVRRELHVVAADGSWAVKFVPLRWEEYRPHGHPEAVADVIAGCDVIAVMYDDSSAVRRVLVHTLRSIRSPGVSALDLSSVFARREAGSTFEPGGLLEAEEFVALVTTDPGFDL